MALSDYKLKFVIDADGRTAKQELDSVYTKINRLGGSATASFGGFIPAAGAAVAALTGIAVAATGAGVALFRLTQEAAEFGSAIFDATQKTGLSAETISALKYAADTSGSSFEAITGSVAKFNVLLGEANAGSDKAQQTLAQYGITARTTDAALAQAIETIAKMTSVDQQAAAAKALFKDRTGEILPVIKSFDGDLPGLMKKLEELGLLLSDEDARAADEFGDTLDTLTKQAAMVGRQFATELMPMVTDAMQEISRWMSDNQGTVREWGTTVVDTVNGSIIVIEDMDAKMSRALGHIGIDLDKNQDSWVSWANNAVAQANRVVLAITTGGLSEFFRYANEQGAKARTLDSNRSTLLDGGSVFSFPKAVASSSSGSRSVGRSGRGDAAREADRLAREAERIAERNRDAQRQIAQIELDKALKTLDALVQKAKEYQGAWTGIGGEDIDPFNEALTLSIGLIEEAQRKLHSLQIENSQNATEYEKQLLAIQQAHEKAALTAEIMEQKEALRVVAAKARSEAVIDYYRREDAARERAIFLLEQEKALRESLTPKMERPGPSYEEVSKALGDQLSKELAVVNQLADAWDRLRTSMEQAVGAQNMLASMGQMGIDMFQNMSNAVGQAIAGWALYGDSIGEALKKALAAELAHIAAVATVNAIYATALGFMRLAMYDFTGAAMAFKSAALWAVLAAGAALGARAISGGGQKAGSGKSDKESNGQQRRQGELSPYSRESEFAYYSGRRNANEGLALAVQKLAERIHGMRPGDVLTAGTREKPGVIGAQAVADIKRNSSIGYDLGRAVGLR